MATAVLFQCHELDPRTLKEFHRLRQSALPGYDFFILYDASRQPPPPDLDFPIFSLTLEEVSELGYAMMGRTLIPGHAHLPLLKFWRNHPDYEFYWVVEYDVRFTGEWSNFFRIYSELPHDLLSCLLRTIEEEPDYCWWDSLQPPPHFSQSFQRIRSFNPIYRVSGRGLKVVHDCQLAGWSGHQEVLFPTLFHHHGLEMAALGGTGRFVPSHLQDRICSTPESGQRSLRMAWATVRFRPPRPWAGWRRNFLYHPVKGHLRTPVKFYVVQAFLDIKRYIGERIFHRIENPIR